MNIIELEVSKLEQIGFIKPDLYDLNYENIQFFFILTISLIFSFLEIRKKENENKGIQNYFLIVIIINIIHYTSLLNIVLCISYNNGLKILPTYIYIIFTMAIKTINQKINFMITTKKVISLLYCFYLFFQIIIVYFADIDNLKAFFLDKQILGLFGKFVIEDNFDQTREILNISSLLFISIYYQLLNQYQFIKMESKDLKQQNSRFLTNRFQDKWYFYIYKHFFDMIIYFSDKMVEISLIIWGLSRVSVIKFIFLLIGLIGLMTNTIVFQKYFSKSAFYLAIFYLTFQTFYNLSFVDFFVKSLGKKTDEYLFTIGFYKYYNLFHGHLLKFTYEYDDIKLKRKNGMIWDTITFSFLFVLLILFKKKPKIQKKPFDFTHLKNISKNILINIINNFFITIINLAFENIVPVSLVFLLITSSLKHDYFHYLYLLMFFCQVFTNKKSNFGYLSNIFIKIISINIILIYLYNLIGFQFDKDLMRIIGLNNNYVIIIDYYKEHLIILFTLIISHKLISIEEKYPDLKKSSKSLNLLKETKKFIIFNHTSILFILTGIIAIVPPYNFFSLFHIVIFFTYRSLRLFLQKNEKSERLYSKFILFWIIYSFIAINLQYIINLDIEKVNEFLFNNEYFNKDSLGFVDKLQNSIFQLLTQGFLILFLKFYYQMEGKQIIRKASNEKKILFDLDSQDQFAIRQIKDPTNWLYYFNFVWRCFKMMKVKYLDTIFVFYNFYFCIKIKNLISITYLFIILISLYKGTGQFWRKYWKMFYFLTLFLLVLQYTSQCLDLNFIKYNFQDTFISRLIAIDSSFRINHFYLIILFFCCLFKEQIKDSQLLMSKDKLKQHIKVKYHSQEGFEQKLKRFIKYINIQNGIKENMEKEEIDYFSYQQDLYLQYYFELPIFYMNYIFNALDRTCCFISHSISLLILIVCSFMEQSFMGIPFLIFAIICNRLISNKRIKFLNYFFQFMFLVISLVLILRFFTITLNFESMIKPLQQYMIKQFCPEDYKNYYSKLPQYEIFSDYENCSNEWNEFLYLTKSTNLQIFSLILLIFQISNSILIIEKLKRRKLSQQLSISLLMKIETQKLPIYKKIFYFWLPKMSLFLFFLCGTITNQVSSQGDLIGIFYAIPGLIFLVNGSYDRKKSKYSILLLLQIINFFFMFLLIFYQLPYFKCPIYQKNRAYYSNNECIYLQERNDGQFFKNTLAESDQRLFQYAKSMIGLMKINQQTFFQFSKQNLMIVFFFLALLIQQIWDLQEYQNYIESKQISSKKGRLIQATKYIFNFFLERFWNYQKYLKKKQIFRGRNTDIDQKIKQWENTMNQKSSTFNVQNEEDFLLIKNKKHKDLNSKLRTNNRILAEQIVSDFSKSEPILEIEKVEELIEKYKGINKEFYKAMRQKQIDLLIETSQQLINFDKLNLQFLNEQKTLKELNLFNSNKQTIELKKLLIEQISIIPLRHQDDNQSLEQISIHSVEDNYLQKIILNTNKLIKNIKSLLIYFIKPNYLYEKQTDDVINNESSFGNILNKLFYCYSEFMIYIVFFMNLLTNGNILAIIPCVFILIIGIVSNPFPHNLFWKILIYYMFVVILLKMIYQLPIFCTTTPYIFSFSQECEQIDINIYFLYSRIDYLIGIRKFYGKSNFSQNNGLLKGLFYDYFSIVILLFHHNFIKKQGIYTYLTTNKSKRMFPVIKLKPAKQLFRKMGCLDQNDSIIKQAIEEELSDLESSQESYESFALSSDSSILMEYNLNKNKFKQIKQKGMCYDIFYRIFPLPLTVPKFICLKDINNQFEHLQYEPLYLKCGINLYKILFLFEITIFVIYIFCYDILIGSSNSFTHALKKSQFSEDMVIVILKLISIILMNRICYCKRYTVLDHKIFKLTQKENHVGDFQKVNEIYAKQSFFTQYNLTIRYLLHILIVIYIHYFFFIDVPQMNKKLFQNLIIAKIIYILFAIYLIVSGKQIKNGFSDHEFVNPYTNEISVWGNFQRKIFHVMPFIFEIKSVLDWTITQTSLDLFQWFKLEDAYITLKLTKYQMTVRKYNPFPIDMKKKFTFGFCFLIFLFGVIIMPIILFSTFNPNYIVNEPLKAEIEIKVWSNQDNTLKEFILFQTKEVGIKQIDLEEYKANVEFIYKMRKNDKLTQFKKLILSSFSEENWNLSRPKKDELLEMLQNHKDIFITASWKIYHDLKKDQSMSFGSNTSLFDTKQQDQLSKIINKPDKMTQLKVNDLFPKMVYLNSSKFLMLTEKDHNNYQTSPPVFLSLKDSKDYYWEMRGEEFDSISFYIHCDYIMGNILGDTLRDMSVIGFYVTIVLAIGQLIKGAFMNITMRVIYEEMPQTNQLIEFCESIYMARKEKDLIREKRLYDLLIRIYRSPELLIQLTGNYNV